MVGSGIIFHDSSLTVGIQMTTLSEAGQAIRRRAHAPCEPVRLRATITMDIEVGDYIDAQQAKLSIQALFAEIRRQHESACLEFKQRRPRARPRPAAPGPIIVTYADD